MEGLKNNVRNLFSSVPAVKAGTDEKQQAPINEGVTPIDNGFVVHAFRYMSRTQTYLKCKDAFKIELINNGNVDIIVFGNFNLPSRSRHVFETGNHDLVFREDTPIEYPKNKSLNEKLDVQLITYSKK